MGSISHSGGAGTPPAQMGPFLLTFHRFAPFLDGGRNEGRQEPDTVPVRAESEEEDPGSWGLQLFVRTWGLTRGILFERGAKLGGFPYNPPGIAGTENQPEPHIETLSPETKPGASK